MTADLDDRLKAALSDAASATHVTDDALSAIIKRSSRNRRQIRRRRTLITGLTVIGVTAGAGAGYALVQDRLSREQAQIVEQVPTCGLSAETARLVATVEAYGRTVDYWVVDGEGRHGDFLFERGSTGGGGGCGEQGRQEAHPTLPWANYMLDAGDGTGLFWFFGQAPVGAAEVEVVMSTGSVRAEVGLDGFFVTLAELPYHGDDHFERVDAFSADGNLIATGGIS